jgi:hypothetical protein
MRHVRNGWFLNLALLCQMVAIPRTCYSGRQIPGVWRCLPECHRDGFENFDGNLQLFEAQWA